MGQMTAEEFVRVLDAPTAEGVEALRKDIEEEMRISKTAVEQWICAPCNVFAYPYGAFSDYAAASAGRLFRWSVTVERGWWRPGSDPTRIPRIAIHEDMTFTRAMFEARLSQPR